MNTLLIVVVLISGYIYVNLSLATRYRYKRSEGWDAYFFVAAWGAVFVFSAWILCSVLSVTGIFRWGVNQALSVFSLKTDVFQRVFPVSFESGNAYKDLKIAVWGLTSIILASLFGFLSKKKTEKNDRRFDAIAKAVGESPLECMLMEASVRQFPIIVTLSSRKFYVGLVSCPAFENGDFKHIELLPLLSGYRDKDSLTINVTTNYRQHYLKQGISGGELGGLSLNDFRTLVNKNDVDCVSFFDPTTYSAFKKSEEADVEQCKSLTPSFQPTNVD